ASAAGFETRIALLSDRSRHFADFSFTNPVFVNNAVVAVKVGSEWRFYDPSTIYCPYGMLPWRQEAEKALISDPKEPVFVQTPLSPASKSVEKRTAALKLDAGGTIEGNATIEYTGQKAIEKKDAYTAASASEREQTVRDMIKAQMSTAEVSDIKFEN